jgi:hypothetical protein
VETLPSPFLSHFGHPVPLFASPVFGPAAPLPWYRRRTVAETTSGPVHDGNRPKDCKTHSREVIRRPVWRPDARLIPRCLCSETLRPTHAVHRREPNRGVPAADREFGRFPFSPLHATSSTPTLQEVSQVSWLYLVDGADVSRVPGRGRRRTPGRLNRAPHLPPYAYWKSSGRTLDAGPLLWAAAAASKECVVQVRGTSRTSPWSSGAGA